MKFGKEFQSQMVPEWQEAYMDYSYLKSVLKDIIRFRPQKQSSSSLHSPGHVSTPGGSSLKRKASLYRAFSGLTNRHNSVRYLSSPTNEEEVIMLSSVRGESELSETRYQTLFMKPSEEGGEYELVFFKRLDDEFNKVVKFYKGKVDEVVTEADELSRQMNALVALRVKVERPHLVAKDNIQLAATSHTPPPPTSPPKAVPHSVAGSRRHEVEKMEMIEEVDSEEGSSRRRSKEGVVQEDQTQQQQPSENDGKAGERMVECFRPPPLEILNHVKINVGVETPRSTVKGILLGTSSLEISFTKAELRKAEEKMTQAFITFHHKLRLLKSYCFLNQLAFSKIMKKYDKITSRNASKLYLKMVDESYLGSSDKVSKLIERVEEAFVKHFSNGNRNKGMKILRPSTRRDRHRVTFVTGGCFGFSLALVVSLIVTMYARNLLEREHNNYMENIFPLYSLFGFAVLHLIMYAGNIYFWMRYRINYPFIFGFKQGTELRYREVLLVASGLTMLMFGGLLLNLTMEMDPKTGNYKAVTELVPLMLLTVVLLITFCPFNIVYRSSRFFLLQCVFHCICAPFYKVTLPDFFLADQLTSQVQAFRNLEFYVCYYGFGDFMKRINTCKSSKVFESFYFIVAIIPYMMRFLQCIRRLFEEKDKMQGYNALKYFSTIIALVLRSLFDLKGNSYWRILAAIFSIISTIISTYWDLVLDWGLLQRNSKNKWLRDKLVIPNHTVYYIAIVLNVILRLAWMQVILGWRQAPFLHPKAVVTIMASLEIIRRGIWNFFRIENEHLNNVGKYRAFKSVPLPFQHGEDKSI